jgi:LacI family transcriptional regulator
VGRHEHVRLVDVARRARVSPSTASRALNQPQMVRPQTRARIEAAAAELGYEPHRIARSLITGRTSTIAVIVPDLTNTYFAHICRDAQVFARERGYDVIIMDTIRSREVEKEVVRSASRWVDGIIICASHLDHRPGPDGPPVVHVNRRVHGCHAIVLDQRFIVEAQIGHLRELGHERILWIDGPKDYWASAVRRRYVERLARSCDIRILTGITPDQHGGMDVARQLDGNVTAVAAFNDRQASGLIAQAMRLGIRVPEDLSVVGSDGIPGSEYIYPALTTVYAPRDEMARAAVSLIIDHVDDRDGPLVVKTLRGHLLVRESTAPPAVAKRLTAIARA